MGVKSYKPYTPSRRYMVVSDFAELTRGARPEKSLLEPLPKRAGRNNQGKITMRRRGGGNNSMGPRTAKLARLVGVARCNLIGYAICINGYR